jgi:hypothetical protein
VDFLNFFFIILILYIKKNIKNNKNMKVFKFSEFLKEEHKGIKGKDLFTFVRFGGLDLKNQKGYKKKNFHSPPTSRGFYAFPKIAQEMFLVGSLSVTQPDNFKEYDNEAYTSYDDYLKDYKKKLSSFRKEFRKENGEIWHHLINNIKPSDIIEINKSWVKTSIKNWAKALRKESLKIRQESGGVNKSKIFGDYSKDYLEVFFDEK